MARHTVKAHKISRGNWILWDTTNDTLIGEERAYQYETRKEAYEACYQMWPENSTWKGKRVDGGYSIEVS